MGGVGGSREERPATPLKKRHYRGVYNTSTDLDKAECPSKGLQFRQFWSFIFISVKTIQAKDFWST